MTELKRTQGATPSFTVDGTEVTATGAELNLTAGLTATTDELNKLDGVASTAAEIDYREVGVQLADLSAASSAFKACPYTGNVIKVYSCIANAISSADANWTTSIAGVAITGGGATVANSGWAAGTVDTATPTAANAVTAGQALSVTTDGGSTDTCITNFTFLIDIT